MLVKWIATVYIQVINLVVEHRAQIATTLTRQGGAPPDFSGCAWDTDQGRSMGWAEASSDTPS